MIKSTPKNNQLINQVELEANFASWLSSTGNRNRGHAEKSVEAYLMDLRIFVRWYEERYQEIFAPAAITRKDYADYFDFTIHQERKSAATWNRRRATLSLFSKFCLVKGYMAFDSFIGVPQMEKAEVAPKSLDRLTYLAFVRKVDQAVQQAMTKKQQRLAIRNRALIYLMLFAGLREGEVCELRASDLLLRDRVGQVTICDGKRHKQAILPIGNEVVSAVRDWLEICGEGGKVFAMTARQIQRVVGEYGDMVNFKVTPHMLRHTFVYMVRKDDGDVQMAMVMARHKRIDQTMRYALPHLEDMAAVAERITH